MAPIKDRRTSVVVLVVASLFVGGLGVVSLRAQGGSPHDALMASLKAILLSVNAISSTLNEHVGAGGDPEPAEVRLSTGAVRVGVGSIVSCIVVNVSDHPIAIPSMRLVDLGGGVLAQFGPLGPEPGHGVAFDSLPFEDVHYVRCESTFTGFADDVRLTLSSRLQATNSPTVVVDAR